MIVFEAFTYVRRESASSISFGCTSTPPILRASSARPMISKRPSRRCSAKSPVELTMELALTIRKRFRVRLASRYRSDGELEPQTWQTTRARS